jgi:hypothetical protein
MPVTTKRRQPATGRKAHHTTQRAIRNLERGKNHRQLWTDVNAHFETTLSNLEKGQTGKAHIDKLSKAITHVANLEHPEDLMPHEARQRLSHMEAVKVHLYRQKIRQLSKGTVPKINRAQKAELMGLVDTLDNVREQHVSHLKPKSTMDGATLRPALATTLTESLPGPFRRMGRRHEGGIIGRLRSLAGETPRKSMKKAA